MSATPPIPKWKELVHKTENIKDCILAGNYIFNEEHYDLLYQGVISLRSAQTRLSLQTLNLVLQESNELHYGPSYEALFEAVVNKWYDIAHS